MENIIRQMEIDQAMKFVYAHHEVNNRRLAYGETIEPFCDGYPFQHKPILLAESVLRVVGFPIQHEFSSDHTADTFSCVEHLMSDVVQSFATTNLSAMSVKKKRSLSQELLGVGPSRRRILLTSKSEMKKAMGVQSVDPVERQVVQILGRKHVLSADLKSIVSGICQTTGMEFHGAHGLERSTKTEILDRIVEQRDQFSSALRLPAVDRSRDRRHAMIHQ
jgi:hypothetical protein